MPEPTGFTEMHYDEESYPVTLVWDGTTTIAQMLDEDGELLAEGVARRRKGERRNQTVGDFLAMGRMYASASERLIAAAEERMR